MHVCVPYLLHNCVIFPLYAIHVLLHLRDCSENLKSLCFKHSNRFCTPPVRLLDGHINCSDNLVEEESQQLANDFLTINFKINEYDNAPLHCDINCSDDLAQKMIPLPPNFAANVTNVKKLAMLGHIWKITRELGYPKNLRSHDQPSIEQMIKPPNLGILC